MFPTFGHPDASVTSRAARIAGTLSPNLFTAGSGRRTGRRWHQLTRSPKAGLSIHGPRLATRRSGNLTTLNSTLMAPTSPACPFSTTSTRTALRGTTWLAITRNHSSAKTPTSFWTMWPVLTLASAFKGVAIQQSTSSAPVPIASVAA